LSREKGEVPLFRTRVASCPDASAAFSAAIFIE